MEGLGAAIATISAVVLVYMIYVYIKSRGRVGHRSIYAIFAASWGMLGVGQVSAWLGTVGNWLADWTSGVGGELLGLGGPALLVLIPAFVVFDLSNAGIWRPTPWFALISPTLLLIVGSAYAGAGGILGALGSFITWVMNLPSVFG